MRRRSIRDWVRVYERADPEDQWTLLCFLAGRAVTLDEDEVNAAVRRAELLLATGGDPHRRLELFGRAVTSVAADLDDPAAREQLADGLRRLEPEIAGLRAAGEALRLLRADADLAWQCFACALLAEELADAT
ncbi:MAG TPA: hypothetical protein VFB26_05695 [Gaiellaceae bacterium]|nr:hypothetical protein [Gaiellaceae bacterium]